MSELQTIGEEVGIDPARLESAARAVVQGGGAQSRGVFGGPRILNRERIVEGVFDSEHTHDVVSVIRRIMGIRGTVEEVGGALEWSSEGESGQRYVTVAERDGKTTIRAWSNLNSAALVTSLGPGMVGLAVSIIGLARYIKAGSELGLILALVMLPTLFAIFRTVVNRISDREADKLDQVVDELTRIAADTDD